MCFKPTCSTTYITINFYSVTVPFVSKIGTCEKHYEIKAFLCKSEFLLKTFIKLIPDKGYNYLADFSRGEVGAPVLNRTDLTNI